MKKTFLILLLSAVGIWGYVIAQIAFALVGKAQSIVASQGADGISAVSLLSRSRPPLDTVIRDPFRSYLYAQKPASTFVKPIVDKPKLKVIEPPRAVLTGILWGERPVAILMQDGRTELVQKGVAVWDLEVVRIDRNQVLVRKQGRPFTLEY
jgi:hypothetical protein